MLSDWPRLGAAGRERAIDTLRRAFHDPATLELLLEAWIRRAPSEAVALEALPDRVQTWVLLEGHYSAIKDWERFASVRGRRVGAQQRELEHRVQEAEQRLTGGDTVGGRSLLLSVLAEAYPDKRHAATLDRVMTLLPAGSIGDWRRRRLRAWLAWAQERCLLEDCPLSPAAIRRIAGSASLDSVHEHAAAAMMAGDADRALSLANRSSSTLLPEWGPYLLLSTRHFARTGELSRARAAFQRVHRSWHPTLAYRVATRALAVATLQAEPAAAPKPSSRWSTDDWRSEAYVHRLELETDTPCGGLRVELSSSGDGSAVEARWNGESFDWFSVESGSRRDLERQVRPGYHVLELLTIGGERLVPKRVVLHPCPV